MRRSLTRMDDDEVVFRLVRARRSPLPEIGSRHGKLTVTGPLAYVVSGIPRLMIRCYCDCGNEAWPYVQTITGGKAISCGCAPKSHPYPPGTKAEDHPLYAVWGSMKQRCYDPNLRGFKDYGGRGIRVCDEWRNDFPAFRDWGMREGYRAGLTLEREDVNGNYEPSNCSWVTPKQQQRNKRNNVRLTAFGETKTAVEWVEDARCCVDDKRLYWRLSQGWQPERALTEAPEVEQYEAFGERKTLKEWAADPRCTVTYKVLWQRLNVNKGFTLEAAITQPSRCLVRPGPRSARSAGRTQSASPA